jgi:hypothetical protein
VAKRPLAASVGSAPTARKPPHYQGFSEVERTGIEPVTPSLQSWCSPS